ncbi:MAG: methyltransferase domain-containing protein [Haloechinothrix sp.]
MDWHKHAKNLAAKLDLSAEWKAGFAAVPRHVFVPRFFENRPELGWVAVDQSDADYLDLVYQNEALITQLDGDPGAWDKLRKEGVYLGGHATSSSSAPGLMAVMVDALQAEPGLTVLEVGTGTGYNAAILCNRLGDEYVTTVDIDAGLVESARLRLAGLGYRPATAVADAAITVPDGPYDRLMATVGIRRVPPCWLTAVKPGGLILANLYSDMASDAIFALTVSDTGTATGRAPIGGTFMPTRDNIMPFNFMLHDNADGEQHTTNLPVGLLTDFGPFYLFASLIMRDVQVHYFPASAGTLRPGLLGRDRSWAYELDGTAVHGGLRNLWAELEDVHTLWQDSGNPGRDRLGLTVAKDQQSLWIDSPEHVIQAEIDAVTVDHSVE